MCTRCIRFSLIYPAEIVPFLLDSTFLCGATQRAPDLRQVPCLKLGQCVTLLHHTMRD